MAGALGRMGRALAAQIATRPGLELAALFDRPGSEGRTVPAGALVSREAALEACEVIVDFTSGQASAELAGLCAARGGPALVIGDRKSVV